VANKTSELAAFGGTGWGRTCSNNKVLLIFMHHFHARVFGLYSFSLVGFGLPSAHDMRFAKFWREREKWV